LLFHGIQFPQETALPAGGIVLMDHAFGCRFVQFPDGQENGGFIALIMDLFLGFGDRRSSPAADDAVSNLFFFVAPDAFDRRF